MIIKLMLSNLKSRWVRTLLTVLAIGFSVGLVVAMTSGFASIRSAAGVYMDRFMGAVDAEIVRTHDPGKGIDESVIRQLRADPRVARVIPRLATDVPVNLNSQANDTIPARVTLVGVERETDSLLDWMKMNRGRWFTPDEASAVIDQGMHEKSGLNVGERIKVSGPNGTLDLPITGIVHRPGLFVNVIQTIYVPLSEAQRFVYGPTDNQKVSVIRIQFVPEINTDAWFSEWNDRLSGIDPLLKLKSTRQTRAQIDANFRSLRLLGGLGGAVAMLSATFIMFSTLSMGVTERQRILAMLRAIGMTRGQVIRFVLGEGLCLGILGTILGISVGFGLACGVIYLLRPIAVLPVVLDGWGVLLGAGEALLASVVAGLIPAWQASRVDPLEAMSPLAKLRSEGFPVRATLAGLLLVLLDPLILFFPFSHPLEREIRFYGHFTIGLPTLMIGFFLLAPALVYGLTQTLGRGLARMFAVPFAVVRQQVSGGIWRSAGTCAALMVGLAVLVVMQTQGNSSLNSWKLPTRFPDIFIYTRSFSGLSPQAQTQIRSSPLLVEQDVMSIGTFSPEVGPGIMGLLGTRLPGATMFVAVEPDKAFRLMELDFREGNAQEATRLLQSGRHVVVTEEFRRLRNLGVGDKLTLKSRLYGPIEYTIAGVVWSPGIDVMVNSFDFSQQFEQQSAACVFGSLEDAKNDFGVDHVYLMCANFRKSGVDKQLLMQQLRESVQDPSIQVADVRHLKDAIQRGLRRLLDIASTIAWGAIAVAGLGVINTIVASIRTRSWQFGVLRSIGLTRTGLIRIILCEAVLLGTIGAGLGVVCGMTLTLNGRRLLDLTIGHHPPLDIPWTIVGIGTSVVIGISLFASIIPAIQAGRTEPLHLLRMGRTST
ncbi:MAG: ABC transporter [Phycisphaerae bacterium]|nr:MAG: ABC transporter [Phycisphaerae bacterium]